MAITTIGGLAGVGGGGYLPSQQARSPYVPGGGYVQYNEATGGYGYAAPQAQRMTRQSQAPAWFGAPMGGVMPAKRQAPGVPTPMVGVNNDPDPSVTPGGPMVGASPGQLPAGVPRLGATGGQNPSPLSPSISATGGQNPAPGGGFDPVQAWQQLQDYYNQNGQPPPWMQAAGGQTPSGSAAWGGGASPWAFRPFTIGGMTRQSPYGVGTSGQLGTMGQV